MGYKITEGFILEEGNIMLVDFNKPTPEEWLNDPTVNKYTSRFRHPINPLDLSKPDLMLRIVCEQQWIGNVTLNNMIHQYS